MSNYWENGPGQNRRSDEQDAGHTEEGLPLYGDAPEPSESTRYPATVHSNSPPYYQMQFGAGEEPPRKPKKQRNGAGLVVICIVMALVFSFAGTALANTLLPGSSDSGTDGSPLYTTVDPGQSLADAESESYANVVDATKETVVEIKTESASSSNPFFGQSIVEGAGSGVIISEDGYIITNNHVVSDAGTVTVVLSDGTSYDAQVVGADARTDIALLKIDATGLPFAVLGDSESLRIGDRVIAIGNPLGSLGGSVTEGIISGLEREIVIGGQSMVLLQTSAAVNPGNSGGGLFNMRGELIGIVNAKSSGTDVEGLGFAVPINTAKDVLVDIRENGYVTGRPEIGISVYTIADAATAEQYGVSRYGVYITSITEGGPAEQAGLMVGDYIVSINGTAIESSSDVVSEIGEHAPGDSVTVQIIRNNRTYDFDVTLREMQP